VQAKRQAAQRPTNRVCADTKVKWRYPLVSEDAEGHRSVEALQAEIDKARRRRNKPRVRSERHG
jgi:hypothetical protein